MKTLGASLETYWTATSIFNYHKQRINLGMRISTATFLIKVKLLRKQSDRFLLLLHLG